MIDVSGCNFSNLTIDAITVMYDITTYAFTPAYLTFGLICNCILIAALVKQAKSEGSYVYQLAIVCSKTCENVTLGLFCGCAYWFAGLGGVTEEWFISSYTLMFIGMRVFLPGYFVSLVCSLFFNVAGSADRVFALSRPFLYKDINKTRHRVVAFSVSIIIACLLTMEYAFVYNIVPDGSGHYKQVNDLNYVGTTMSLIWEGFLSGSRILAMVILFIFNVITVLAYRKRMLKLAKMANSQDKANARKDANKELFILSLCQSILTFIDQTPHIIMQVIRKMSAYGAKCGLALGPIANGSIMVSDMAEFFVVILVNKKVRENVMKIFCKGASDRRITPMGTSNQKQHTGTEQQTYVKVVSQSVPAA